MLVLKISGSSRYAPSDVYLDIDDVHVDVHGDVHVFFMVMFIMYMLMLMMRAIKDNLILKILG